MTSISNEARARLMASKAEYEKKKADAEAADRAAREEREFMSFKAGEHWALDVATYEELDRFVTKVTPNALALGAYSKLTEGHDAVAFQKGAKSILDEIEGDSLR
jgi:hypothetical protein